MSIVEIVVMEGDPLADIVEGETLSFVVIDAYVSKVSVDKIDATGATDGLTFILDGPRRIGLVAKEIKR